MKSIKEERDGVESGFTATAGTACCAKKHEKNLRVYEEDLEKICSQTGWVGGMESAVRHVR